MGASLADSSRKANFEPLEEAYRSCDKCLAGSVEMGKRSGCGGGGGSPEGDRRGRRARPYIRGEDLESFAGAGEGRELVLKI